MAATWSCGEMHKPGVQILTAIVSAAALQIPLHVGQQWHGLLFMFVAISRAKVSASLVCGLGWPGMSIRAGYVDGY